MPGSLNAMMTTAEQYPHDSDLAMWMGEGYTPNRYVGAWRSAFKMYRELFPHQYLSLALIDGLPIGNDHMLDPSQITATPLAVIAAGRRYGSRFVLQADGLGASSGSGGPPEPYVQGNCGTIATGFQTHSPTRENGGGGLDTDDLQAGVNAGADFIEVYEEDVLDGLAERKLAHQPIEHALKKARSKLLANPGCDPLTLSATPETATVGTAATVTATLGPSATSCPTIAGACPNLLTNLNFLATQFNPPYSPTTPGSPFDFKAYISIYAGTQLLGTCNTGTGCSVNVTPGLGSTRFAAEIGAADTLPFSSQAVVSATTTVQRTKFMPCKPHACT